MLISQLPTLYQECEGLLCGRHRTRGERVRGGTRSNGIALDHRVVAVRADILTVMSSWAGFIADGVSIKVRPRRQVPALARFLLDHLDWLVQHSSVTDAAAEIDALVVAAEEVVDPPRSPRLDIGPCPRPGCGGEIRTRTDGTGRAAVACENGHRWQPHEWLLLGPFRRPEHDTVHAGASR